MQINDIKMIFAPIAESALKGINIWFDGISKCPVAMTNSYVILAGFFHLSFDKSDSRNYILRLIIENKKGFNKIILRLKIENNITKNMWLLELVKY